MAFDGTLKFDTALDSSGFKGGVDSLGGIAQAGMNAVAGAVSAAVNAVASLGTAAVSVGREFEAGMSQVQATLGISVSDLKNNVDGAAETMEALTKKAEEMGATTQYTAAQAADGLNILAMSGFNAEQSIAMIDSTLSLAAAGGLELSRSAQFIAGSMKGFAEETEKFKDEAEASFYFADIIAKGATMAATNVDQLGEAMQSAAAIAGSYNQTSQATEVALLRLAEQGVTGSNAATNLAAAMANIYTPMDQAKEALDQLGVSAYDETGNMRDFNAVVDDLGAALKNYAPEDAAKLEDVIFGRQGKTAFDKMIVSSSDKVAQFYEGLAYNENGALGSAAEQAEAMMDNLNGDITYLESAVDGLYNTMYKSMNGTLRELVQTGNTYVTQITDAFNADGAQGAAQALGDVLSQALTKIGDYLPDMVELGTSIVSALFDGLTANSDKIIKTGIDLALTLLSGFSEVTADMLEFGAGILQSLAEGIEKRLPRIRRIARQTLKLLADSLSENLPLMLEAGISILEMLSEVFIENLPLLVECADTIIQSLVKALSDPEMLTALLGAGLAILESLLQIIGDNIGLLITAAIQIVETLGVWIADHAVELATAAIELVTVIVSAILEHANELNEAAFAIIRAVVDNLTEPEQMEKLMHAAGELIREFFKGLGTYGTELGEFTFDLFEALGNALGEIDWAQLGKAIVEGICSGLLGTDFDLNSYLSDFGDNWVSGIKDIFGIHSPSKLMRDQIGKNLALGVGEGFVEEMPDVGQGALDAFRDMEHEVLRVHPVLDESAFDALREIVPEMAASRYIDPPASTQYITNYDTSYITNSEHHAAPEPAAPGGDIIIPVSIGGQQIDTIVIKAAQIANARSGGVTL